MKVAIVLCLIALHGCTTAPHTNPALHDGRWGEYNELKANECAMQAMVDGIDNAEITKLFNICVFKAGITI